VKGLVILDESAIRRLRKAVGSDLPIVLYIADWLLHLNIFTDAQVYDILSFVKTGIEQFDSAAAENKLHPTTIGVHDSRWVSMSGKPSFLDTKTAEEVPEMPFVAVTHIICDLVALRERMLRREGQFHGNRTGSNESVANDDKAG
jgi:hypothetical protein